MARARLPRDPVSPRNVGPPGLGGKISDDVLGELGENPTPPGTNPEMETESATIEGLMALPVLMEQEKERLDQLWSDFLDQNAAVEQTSAQLRTLEQMAGQHAGVLEQYRIALLALEQRLNALAQQQLQSNLRMAALQLAVQGKSAHDTPEKIVKLAEAFHKFLLRDLVLKVAPPLQEEVKSPDGLDPESTKH